MRWPLNFLSLHHQTPVLGNFFSACTGVILCQFQPFLTLFQVDHFSPRFFWWSVFRCRKFGFDAISWSAIAKANNPIHLLLDYSGRDDSSYVHTQHERIQRVSRPRGCFSLCNHYPRADGPNCHQRTTYVLQDKWITILHPRCCLST